MSFGEMDDDIEESYLALTRLRTWKIRSKWVRSWKLLLLQ